MSIVLRPTAIVIRKVLDMSSPHACEVGDHGQEMTTIKIPSTGVLEGPGRGREITTPPKAVVTNPFNSQALSIYSRSRRSEAGSHFISAEDFRYNTVCLISFLFLLLAQI